MNNLFKKKNLLSNNIIFLELIYLHHQIMMVVLDVIKEKQPFEVYHHV
jgi:hypothetical protein